MEMIVVDLAKTREAPIEQMFDELGRVVAGMLGVVGGQQALGSMSPMAPHLDRERRTIYFFSRRSSQLVASVGSGALAQFCLVGKDHDYYACLSGPIVQNNSDAAIDRYWSLMVSAWFPGGRDDPELTLLEFTPSQAHIWASTDSSVQMAWELTKAMASGSQPDVGVALTLDMADASR
jgi:general stress protein 26